MTKKELIPPKANIGDIIEFTRKNYLITGKVIKLLDNSVIVELSTMDSIPNEKTVVSHKHYTVIQRNEQPPSAEISFLDEWVYAWRRSGTY